jgi:hypothetical protein
MNWIFVMLDADMTHGNSYWPPVNKSSGPQGP